MRFLIIDDDRMGLEVLVETVESLFKRAVLSQANNSGDAERLIRTGEFDVILCDQNLGHGQTGLALLKLLRQELGRKTSFILITGNTHGIRDILNAVKYDRFSVLEKPFTSLKLLEAISFAVTPASPH